MRRTRTCAVRKWTSGDRKTTKRAQHESSGGCHRYEGRGFPSTMRQQPARRKNFLGDDA